MTLSVLTECLADGFSKAVCQSTCAFCGWHSGKRWTLCNFWDGRVQKMIFARFEMDFAKFCKIAPKRKNEGISTSEMDFAGFRNLFCRNSQNLVLGGLQAKCPSHQATATGGWLLCQGQSRNLGWNIEFSHQSLVKWSTFYLNHPEHYTSNASLNRTTWPWACLSWLWSLPSPLLLL